MPEVKTARVVASAPVAGGFHALTRDDRHSTGGNRLRNVFCSVDG